MPETLQRRADLETDLSWDLFQPSQLLVAELKGVAQGGAGKGRAELASGFPQPLQVCDSVHRSGPSNYYELLGVHPGASTEEVKRAFFSKSKEVPVPLRWGGGAGTLSQWGCASNSQE